MFANIIQASANSSHMTFWSHFLLDTTAVQYSRFDELEVVGLEVDDVINLRARWPHANSFTSCCGLQTLNLHSGQMNNVVGAMPAHMLAAMATTPAGVHCVLLQLLLQACLILCLRISCCTDHCKLEMANLCCHPAQGKKYREA